MSMQNFTVFVSAGARIVQVLDFVPDGGSERVTQVTINYPFIGTETTSIPAEDVPKWEEVDNAGVPIKLRGRFTLQRKSRNTKFAMYPDIGTVEFLDAGGEPELAELDL